MRLLIVQYAGDYREVFQRFAKGESETYYAQKYSVEACAEISKQIEEVTVLCCMTKSYYNEVLQNGVRAIGAGFNNEIQTEKLLKLIEEQNPTHLIVRTPVREVFRWAIQNKVQTIAILADSFSQTSLRNRWRHYSLKKLLNNSTVEWVCNHGINSSLSLKNIGVKPSKIVPWDWPSTVTPNSFSPKILSADVKNWSLAYVGSITESKGVGDILESIAELRAKNLPVVLKIAGRGNTEHFANKAKQLQIDEWVEFLGLVPNNAVLRLMRESDVVIVPSRHEYAEGFPMTLYEALCSRTPIIASDHPMFQNNLKHGVSAMIFPAGNSIALSESIEKLLSDPDLYRSLSVASGDAWNRLQIPVKWGELVERWVYDSNENRQWLFDHRLDSAHYRTRFA